MKYPDMDSYIRQLQRARSISLLDLSRMLGYSSPTSLTRLMNASANRASLQQFADRLHACAELRLTRQESNLLDDLIELHDIGPAFREMMALRRLLRGEPVETQPVTLYDKRGVASSFLRHFGPLQIRRMVLVNSEQIGLYGDLALLMEKNDFSVEHMFYADNRALHTVNALRGTMPVMFMPRYRSYTRRLDFELTLDARGVLTSDMLMCEYARTDGTLATELIVFTALDRGEILHSGLPMDDLLRLLPRKEDMQPVLEHVTGYDLLQYNKFCAAMERDRMVCRIRPDLSLVHIPLPELARVFFDCAPPEAIQSIHGHGDDFLLRQKNMLEKQAPEYHILRRGTMLRFAHTGVLSGNQSVFRPFTLQERISILRYVRHTLMTRPHLHFLFLKDDDALQCDDITLYEDRGLSFIRHGEAHTPLAARSEVFLTQQELLHIFSRFITQSTLRYRVDTREDAARFFDALIAECEVELRLSSTEVDT